MLGVLIGIAPACDHARVVMPSCRREQAHPDLTYVEVDELRVFVRDVAPKISADEAVPPTQSESASATPRRHTF